MVENTNMTNDVLLLVKNYIEKQYNDEDYNLLKNNINELHKLISQYPEGKPYHYISQDVHVYYKNKRGANTMRYQKLHLLLLIQKQVEGNLNKFPEVIIRCYLKYYQRMVKKIAEDKIPAQIYEYNNDRFLKIQSICSCRAIPVDPFFLEQDKLPLKVLFQGSFKQFFDLAFHVLFKHKGAKPFLKTHTNVIDSASLLSFNAKGWRHMFLNLSSLLKEQTSIKGICGSSWFIDPHLTTISPELSYINDLLKELGASIYKSKADHRTYNDALVFNNKRKKMYEEGKYVPCKYLFIIDRKKLIEWGNKNLL